MAVTHDPGGNFQFPDGEIPQPKVQDASGDSGVVTEPTESDNGSGTEFQANDEVTAEDSTFVEGDIDTSESTQKTYVKKYRRPDDSPPANPSPEPGVFFTRKRKRLAAVLLTATIGSGLAAVLLTRGGSSEDTTTSITTVTTSAPTGSENEPALPPGAEKLTTPSTLEASPAKARNPGPLDLAHLPVTGDYVAAISRNGVHYRIPTLPDPNTNPDMFGRVATALWSCALSFDDNYCRSAYSVTQPASAELQEQFDKEEFGADNYQAVLTDSAENPARFTAGSDADGSFVEATPNTIFYGVVSGNDGWQGKAREGSLDYRVAKLRYYYKQVSDGQGKLSWTITHRVLDRVAINWPPSHHDQYGQSTAPAAGG